MKNRKERANRGKVNAAKTSQGAVVFETKHPTGGVVVKVSELPDDERCPTCGQPDNCGDCNHVPLSDADLSLLGLERG